MAANRSLPQSISKILLMDAVKQLSHISHISDEGLPAKGKNRLPTFIGGRCSNLRLNISCNNASKSIKNVLEDHFGKSRIESI